MLKNYFKIAVRHLTTHKLFSLINILCLAIGITFSMIIGVYILPLAYIMVNHWLQSYAYRIEQSIAPYLFAGAFVFVTAFIFVTLQCFKTALANPVKSLRTE